MTVLMVVAVVQWFVGFFSWIRWDHGFCSDLRLRRWDQDSLAATSGGPAGDTAVAIIGSRVWTELGSQEITRTRHKHASSGVRRAEKQVLGGRGPPSKQASYLLRAPLVCASNNDAPTRVERHLTGSAQFNGHGVGGQASIPIERRSWRSGAWLHRQKRSSREFRNMR